MGLGEFKQSDSELPKPFETELAKEARDQLIDLFGKKKTVYELEIGTSEEEEKTKVRIPSSALKFLFEILKQMADGNAVIVIPRHAQLTTQDAANFLNVSRPYLIKLLDKGEIPHTKVGRHRRIQFDEIVKYNNMLQSKSKKARENLTQNSQDFNTGY